MPISPFYSIVCVSFFVVLSTATQTLAEDTVPNAKNSSANKIASDTRFVQFEKALIHCGPNKEHYVTGMLERGATVEVYHQTKDGWCGIRPPEGSHDWLAADQAYLLPGGKQAEVVGNKAPAWIGTTSELKDQRFRWQIELQPSQKVDVIGELKQAIDSDKVRLWYKILPPPGEFRWIRSEALSTAPPKIRSTTVTLANPPPSKSDSDQEPAQQAAFQNVIERVPAPGEYIEGEGIVIGGDSGAEHISQGQIVDEGYVSDGIPSHWNSGEEIIVGDSMDGEYIVDDSIVDGEIIHDGSPCPTCNQVGCTTCNDASHQTDSFQHWDAVEAIGNPKLRFRPIGRILGLIGLSVVEGERIPGDPCQRCPIGCGCANCIRSRADLNPCSSARFNHLPRPIRRTPRQFTGDWLGATETMNESYASLNSPSQSGSRSLLEPTMASRDWQGLAPARLGSSLGSFEPNLNDMSSDRRRLDNGQSAIVAASAQAGELHFSTPEIQQAMVELSRAVAESMDRWDLRDHAARAQQWIEQASDPIARGEARLLLERIESFEILRRRSQTTAETAYLSSTSSEFPTASAVNSIPASLAGYERPIGQPSNSTSLTGQPFPASPTAPQRNPDGTPASDASGWLVQVHSAEYGQPEYALTDDYGGLVAYVQPSPGMNLSRYLKQPVGIYGAKGYIPSLSARQIVAERIVRLR